MNYTQLETYILTQISNTNEEYTRVFHGRGGAFENYEQLTIDSIDEVLYAVLYKEVEYENEVLQLLEKISYLNKYKAIVLQRRYLFKSPIEVLFGTLPQEIYAIENGLKYKLNLQTNQNIGFFADMKNGRKFVAQNAQDKNILNLFAYTCSFSVTAINAKANQVVNVDMAKSSLHTGRINHQINDLDSSKVQFLPYDILKSWSKIKKYAPYDLIIIDPPSFQKGSFAAHKDYVKIIRRLDQLASHQCTILSCLNAVDLESEFLINLMKENQPTFKFQKALETPKEFPSKEPQKALKNLVFANY